MKKRPGAMALALATLAALALAATASAAYTSAKLNVSYPAAGTTRIIASSDVNDDATARAAIVIANGTVVNTSAAPGTKVGTVQAQVSALALGGALLPLAGDIIVAPPGAVPAASQTACIGAIPPTTTYLLVLQAAGQTINLPAYIIPTAVPLTTLGASQLVFCLAPPDIPVDKGGATFGAKFLSADLTFDGGIFSPLAEAVWMGFWTPWTPLTGVVNAAGTVISADVIAPGAVTLKGKRVKGRVVLTGRATQAGEGEAFKVQIWGAVGKAAFKRMRTVTAKDNGTYATTLPKTAKQTTFQARVVASELVISGADAGTVCQNAFAGLPFPCSSFTLSGFKAQSKAVPVR